MSLKYNFIRTFDIYSKLFDYYISLDMGIYPYIFVGGLILKSKNKKKSWYTKMSIRRLIYNIMLKQSETKIE